MKRDCGAKKEPCKFAVDARIAVWFPALGIWSCSLCGKGGETDTNSTRTAAGNARERGECGRVKSAA